MAQRVLTAACAHPSRSRGSGHATASGSKATVSSEHTGRKPNLTFALAVHSRSVGLAATATAPASMSSSTAPNAPGTGAPSARSALPQCASNSVPQEIRRRKDRQIFWAAVCRNGRIVRTESSSMGHRPRSPSLSSSPRSARDKPRSPCRAWRMASVKSSGCCWRTQCDVGIVNCQGPAA